MPTWPTATFLGSLTLLGAGLLGCGSDSSPAGTPGGSGASGDGATTGSGPGGSGSTSSGASTGAGASGTGGGSSYQGYTRVDTKSAAVSGSADVAVASDGMIYVSWVDEQNGMRDVFVARSTDGGKSFGAAVQLDDAAIEPLVSMARHPYVAADKDRVAVVFNDQNGTVYLYVSAASDALSFGQPTVIGADITSDFRDFPKAIFQKDGKLAVAWHGYPATGARIFLSRESAGFAAEDASGGAPGIPCECCPLDLVQTQGGDLMTAFRNNVGSPSVREMWLATAPSAGAFSSWVAVSTSEGVVDACPMQGPRLAQTGDSGLLAVWSARGSQNPGAVLVSSSTDGGATWSGGAPIDGFMADEPTLAVGGSGRIFVTGVTGSASSSVVWSDDGGATWSQPESLQAPDGDLVIPQAEGGAGIAALAGINKGAGTVWLRRME